MPPRIKEVPTRDGDILIFQIYLETEYIGYIRRQSGALWESVETLPRGARGIAIKNRHTLDGLRPKPEAVAELVAWSERRKANG